MIRFSTVLIALILAVASASAQIEQTPAAQIPPWEALQRATQLRAEAGAHEDMARQYAAMSGGSRRDRRWRRTMIELCHEYMEAATRAAEAYERAAAPWTSASTSEEGSETPPLHATVPVTAAEYDARAFDYEQEAARLRSDADRHLAMLRSSRAPYTQQPQYGGVGTPPGRGGTWIETARARSAREHCQDAVENDLELARRADDMAKHYRLRAQQLRAAR